MPARVFKNGRNDVLRGFSGTGASMCVPFQLASEFSITPCGLRHALYQRQQLRWHGRTLPHHLPAVVVGVRPIGHSSAIRVPMVREWPDEMERIAVDHQQMEIANSGLTLDPTVRLLRIRVQLRHNAGRADLKRCGWIQQLDRPAYVGPLVILSPSSCLRVRPGTS
jgi:hypothetical protein